MASAKSVLFGTFLLLGLGSAASADVTGFLGNLVSAKGPAAGFLGSWVTAPGGDIEHIVVTASSSGPVRIQVFGRCEAGICNWGALPARIRTSAPNSENVVSLSADFNLGFALRHITLHQEPGSHLRFEMVTEFTDGSERHDYEVGGSLVPMGRPAAAAVPPSAPQSNIATPSAPSGDVVQPVALTAAAGTEDCFSIDTAHSYITGEAGNWKLRDFLHVVQNFGPYREAANKSLAVLTFYRFNEICHVGRGAKNLSLYRASGEVPHQPMPGEDCNTIDPAKAVAVKHDDDWQVESAGRVLLDYGSDRDGANQAASMITALKLSRQCFFDRKNLAASYWLSR